jgi:hypothetical protein
MKKLILATFTILIFCLSTFAQTEENSSCPTLSVTGPSGSIPVGNSIIFIASLNKQTEIPNLKYKWTVERAEIIKGQGTNTITVKTELGFEENLTATVEILGLPEICRTLRASETTSVDREPEAEKIEEFVFSGSAKDEEYLDKFAQKLKDESNADGYILISYETGLSQNNFDKRVQKIRQYLINNKNIEPDRFVFVNVGEIKNLIQLWIVPAGASPPIP